VPADGGQVLFVFGHCTASGAGGHPKRRRRVAELVAEENEQYGGVCRRLAE